METAYSRRRGIGGAVISQRGRRQSAGEGNEETAGDQPAGKRLGLGVKREAPRRIFSVSGTGGGLSEPGGNPGMGFIL
jgi:hypothetical protein